MRINPLLVLIHAFLVLCASASICRAGDDWRPIDPAHLAMKTPVVEKDADAEAIFWEVRIDAHGGHPIFNHYIRIKIFTPRGVETQSKVDLEYFGSYKIEEIAGRTIKPDGSIVELRQDAIFDRPLIKSSGIKVNVRSFAMPAVEPGALVEYKWREERNGSSADYIRLQFQRNIPVQVVKYSVKPKSSGSVAMTLQPFHGAASWFVKENDGFYGVTMTNMPAFHIEPRMPPEDNERTWSLAYYKATGYGSSFFWIELGNASYEKAKGWMKVNDDIRKAAASAIGDASTPEKKIEKLYDFCKTRIKNASSPDSGLTEADREKFKRNDSAADTLKRGIGTSADITLLFATLASAAGFDARICLMADRSDVFFNKSFSNPYFLNATNVAVWVGKELRFFDPGEVYLPFGMIRWQEEGIDALVLQPMASYFVRTPYSSTAATVEKRTANLKLTEDGVIEGDVRIEFLGHFGVQKKRENGDASPEEREKAIKESVKQRMREAELSDIKIENIFDYAKPLVYSYHIKVPGYAQRTGKRLFLQPAFFQRGAPPQFPTSTRIHPVYFHYPWSENDKVAIELPKGFVLDNADSPQPFNGGLVSKYEMSLGVTDGRTLVMNRTFLFGEGGAVLFPQKKYALLKQLFDALHERDNHMITLKQTASNPQ